jgi:hypothetical protein
VHHPPFHFDYIEAVVSNALAFRDADYSFIGVTMPLVSTLWDSCVELSRSTDIGALLDIPETPEREEAILTIMFQTQLTFVVTHEYTHHVHGHLSERALGSPVFNEIASSSESGNLEMQAFEMDADGYAVYHVLSHLITGPRREATMLLSCKHAPASVQDEILFSSFVMAMGAFLLVLSPSSVDLSRVYTRTHPLPAARMNWIMRHATGWCKQNGRSALITYMASNTFQATMAVVERAISGIRPANDWREQTVFLKSEEGSKYLKELDALVRAHVQAL